MRYRHATIWIGLVIAAWVHQPVFGSELHRGRIMGTAQRRVMLQEMETQMELSFDVAMNAKITRDGKNVKLDELKPGDTASVVTQTDGRAILAVMIDAQAPRVAPKRAGGSRGAARSLTGGIEHAHSHLP